jgi:S-adenosylmethionine hydrolase
MGTVITLTSDFGYMDACVAEMKGVILDINPEARFVDICHSIKPQNISQGAFIISTAYRYLPKKAIHLVVVDPGVGTERRAIILKTKHGTFVAPDNGVLSYIVQSYLTETINKQGSYSIKGKIKLGEAIEVVRITNPRFWRSPISPTFHGRDVFAPVAAALSLGFPPVEFGEPQTLLEMLPIPRPEIRPGGSLVGHIIHIDNFGNLITDIRGDDLPPAESIGTIDVCKRLISGIVRTYAEGNGLIALVSSSGYLELALKGGNAASLLDAKVGDEVKLKRQPEEKH